MSEFDHEALIAGLSAPQRAALLEQTDAHGLRHFAVHAGTILAGGTLIAMGVPFWPLIMLIQGLAICFLFTTLHETCHRTPFKTDALNVWVGRICGFLTFLGPEWFRYFHFAHHRFTHDPDHDPELASPKPETRWQYVTYLSGIPETVERVKTLLRNAARPNKDSFVPERGKAKIRTEARVQLALYTAVALASVALGNAVVLYVWLIPFVVAGPFLRAYLLAEHAGCPHVPSMLDNTRTTLTNRVVRALAWNMPYHAEHHAYPAVPFHKLPAFHAHTRPHISHLEDGYGRFNRAYISACQTDARP